MFSAIARYWRYEGCQISRYEDARKLRILDFELCNEQNNNKRGKESMDKMLLSLRTIKDTTIGYNLPDLSSECLWNELITVELPDLNNTINTIIVNAVDFFDFNLENSYHIDEQISCTVDISLMPQADLKSDKQLMRSAFTINSNNVIESLDPGSAARFVLTRQNVTKLCMKLVRKVYKHLNYSLHGIVSQVSVANIILHGSTFQFINAISC